MELFHTEDSELFTPIGIAAGQNGSFYISDFGDNKIKVYSSDGRPLGEIGDGAGEAPSEFLNMLDMKVLGDSLIAVVDRNNMRVAFFDVVSEKLFRTIPMSSASSRIAVTGTGRVYLLLSRHEKMFETYSLQNSDNSQYIGILSDDQINNGILLSGMLSAVDEDVVWASSFLPIIVRLDSTGAIVYARKTIEGEVSDPAKLEVASSETTKSTRIKGKRLHGYVVTDSGKLFIHSSLNKVQNSTAVDVYEASNGDYLYSIKIPFYSGYVWMSKNRFYATKDTSAVTGSIDEV